MNRRRYLRPVSARYMHAKEVQRHAQKSSCFKTDKEAEDFVDTADLSEYDLSDMVPMRFELRKKDRAVSLHMPEQFYEAVKQKAVSVGVSYQRFIGMAIKKALLPAPGAK